MPSLLRISDSVSVQRLDMVIAFAIEAKGKPKRLSISQAAMAISVGFHLPYEDLVEDLRRGCKLGLAMFQRSPLGQHLRSPATLWLALTITAAIAQP